MEKEVNNTFRNTQAGRQTYKKSARKSTNNNTGVLYKNMPTSCNKTEAW